MNRDDAFARLGRSRFRSSFRLTRTDRAQAQRYGRETVRKHLVDFVREKLAPARPAKDGRQTPYRGHPGFKAMHGCAMCCRSCMNKWWKVPIGVQLSEVQQRKAVDFLMAWLERQSAWEVAPQAGELKREPRRAAFSSFDTLGSAPKILPELSERTISPSRGCQRRR